MIGPQHFLIVSAVMFAVGIYGILARRNILGLLMSIELLFNAVGINFITFNRYLYPDAVWGHAATLFVITLAAAEAVVGLALVITMVREVKTVLIEKLNILKG